MKCFLLSNPNNCCWIESQEKCHKYLLNIENVSHLDHRELYPELRQQAIQPILGEYDIYPSKKIMIEARQRQLYHELMKDILKIDLISLSNYALVKESKCYFFYFHQSIINKDTELTYLIFRININVFSNWINERCSLEDEF